jgi:membrane-bound lytic murein transglycosylase A
MMIRHSVLAAFVFVLAACTTTPTEAPKPTPAVPAAAGPIMRLQPSTYADMPGWAANDHAPALAAFRKSCAAIGKRPDEERLSRISAYGGTVGEWRPACKAAETAADPRAFFETHFTPYAVSARADQMRKVTGYYEPVVEARRTPAPGFEEPFLSRPADLVGIDVSRWEETIDLPTQVAEDAMRNLAPTLPDEIEPATLAAIDDALARRFRTPLWGRLAGEREIVPYHKRADVDLSRGILAYGRACDVYDTQVQGSARVRFEDGTLMRMGFAGLNGWRWTSIYRQLHGKGLIKEVNKKAVCAYLAAQDPAGVRAAMNLDPSYVFFRLDPILDPNEGPQGAQSVPLTPLGSMAVDPAFHPYTAPIFVVVDELKFNRLLIAQDTGSAIRRGPLRGDIYWGSGVEGLKGAESTNHEPRFWTLLPKGVTPPAS